MDETTMEGEPRRPLDVSAALAGARRPRSLRLAEVERLWDSARQEAELLGEHPLRVLQRRHAVLDARAAGLLGFDGLMIAVLAAVVALRLLVEGDLLTGGLAVFAGLALLIGSWYSLQVLTLPRVEPDPCEATLLARVAVELGYRARQFRMARRLTELAGIAVALLTGALLAPHVPSVAELLERLG